MFKDIMKSMYNFKKRSVLIKNNIIRMGVESTIITIVMSFFIGVVLALQTGYQLSKFNLTNLLGAIVGLSLLKELAPVQAAVLIAGKVGSSITAELGSMKVSEEIDAIHIMGIDVNNYLIMPRFIGCTISTLILVIYTDFVGFLGGAFISNIYYNVGFENFLDSFVSFVDNIDIISNLLKAFIFGLLISLISCYFGIRTTGGSEEVGKSTTVTVVVSFMVILIANFFLTRIMLYF
ncbi:ABC transporter permease [Candidatus Dependentiae bacterium]|nr:ABC transporter permease [Candidatus Dependentiae bacterium]